MQRAQAAERAAAAQVTLVDCAGSGEAGVARNESVRGFPSDLGCIHVLSLSCFGSICFLVLGSWFLLLASWFLVCGFLVSGYWLLVHGYW